LASGFDYAVGALENQAVSGISSQYLESAAVLDFAAVST
jgi:hypothetical protein